MASGIVHMSVAKKINKVLNLDEDILLLGAISPDVNSKVGFSRDLSHFTDKDGRVDIDAFLNKYKDKLDDTFFLGWFIHIYTDLLWEKLLLDKFIKDGYFTLLNGEKIIYTEDNFSKYLYNDYNIVDVYFLDKYNIDMEYLRKKSSYLTYEIEEIPVTKIYFLFDYIKKAIKENKNKNSYLFDVNFVDNFVDDSSKIILDYMRNNDLISK